MTIRLRAQDFYEVIADESRAKSESIIVQKESRASNLIVLVESDSGVAISISGGDMFVYSCAAQLSSFEIESILKETVQNTNI